MLEKASHWTYPSLVRFTSLSLSYKHEEIQKGESGFDPGSFEPVLSNPWSVPLPVLTPKSEPCSWTAVTVGLQGHRAKGHTAAQRGRGPGLDSAAFALSLLLLTKELMWFLRDTYAVFISPSFLFIILTLALFPGCGGVLYPGWNVTSPGHP